MMFSRNAPFAHRYLRIVSLIALLLSIGSTALLSIIAVYTWLDDSHLKVPFVVVGALNIISTTLILVFSLWEYSVLVTILAGGLPGLVVAGVTGGLWSVSVIKFGWLPGTVVVRDTRWIVTAAITTWVLKLTLEVVFWTLVVATRCRRLPPRKPLEQDNVDDLPTSESRSVRPISSHSVVKQETSRPPVRRSLLLLQNLHKNWSRPFRSSKHPAASLSFRDASATPPPIRPIRPPRSPPRPFEYALEPSPFTHSTSSLHGATSPFLNLINRPKSARGAPLSPLAATFPMAVREQEASALAVFDDWDTSQLPLRDRIAYSLAAAQALMPNPGEPPHARIPPRTTSLNPSIQGSVHNSVYRSTHNSMQNSIHNSVHNSIHSGNSVHSGNHVNQSPNTSNNVNSNTNGSVQSNLPSNTTSNVNSTNTSRTNLSVTVNRPQRSSSMPTPPRTPPAKVQRAVSTGSNQSRRQSIEFIPPVPTSPSSTPQKTIRPLHSSSNLKHLGVNIPLCDSPDREGSVRLGSSPLQASTTLRDVENVNRESTLTAHSKFSDTSPSRASSRSSDDVTSWQTRWASTLERKVTPPIPGFELSPRESMRRMREEREKQSSRQRQRKHQHYLSGTSWIAEDNDENDMGIENSGVRSRRSYAAPATPNTGEFPRSLVRSMIEDPQDEVIANTV
ncbi:hypothetical protein TWF694_006446 [Orbilia ellipsospora]|uniref:Uncharacterized protein n=1 Tax=Orbilia ellipsospora TaxID=2528407 RepID=A0AAV9XKI9_9PEZI